jgi:hypothetical protein
MSCAFLPPSLMLAFNLSDDTAHGVKQTDKQTNQTNRPTRQTDSVCVCVRERERVRKVGRSTKEELTFGSKFLRRVLVYYYLRVSK